MLRNRFRLNGFKVGIALLALLVLLSCTQPASNAPSNSQAQTMNAAVLAGIAAALSGAGAPALTMVGTKPHLAVPLTMSGLPYSNPAHTYTITGTDTAGPPEVINVTITFNNYSAGGITFNSGSATFNLTYTSSTNFSGSYTGSFNITYQGQMYSFGWDISFLYTGSAASFTGTFTINGTTYTYSA